MRSDDFSTASELQIGKAGEYLVCADLLTKGFNAFPSDQGLPYDVVIDFSGRLFKVQVKTTVRIRNYDNRFKEIQTYRFSLRKGAGARRKIAAIDCDFFAFVALDRKLIAYLPYSSLICKKGQIKQIMEFKTRSLSYSGRTYSNGTIRSAYGKFMEDYVEFRPSKN